MSFSELYEIIVKKVTVVGFRGGAIPWIRPWYDASLIYSRELDCNSFETLI